MKNLQKAFIAGLFLLLSGTIFAKAPAAYKLTKTANYNAKTKIELYEHTKSGALIIYINNDDTNRACAVGFKTRAENDKGLPHIFEHSCISGSNKYPSSNLVYQMMSQTYNTFMNALTYRLATVYPIASLSEDQLFASFDFYLNGVFDPLILTDEMDFKREAYRYTLDPQTDEMSATGAVYNELLGVYGNIDYFNLEKSQKLLLPGSLDANESGGLPEEIIKVDWQEVKDFHAKYYHPSNMIIYLYGKLDLNRFLNHFDSEFLSKYNRKNFDLQDSDYKPFTGTREAIFDFPAAKGSRVDQQSIFTYSFTLPDYKPEDLNQLRVIASYLTRETGYLTNQLLSEFPGANLTWDVETVVLHPNFSINVKNINPEDKKRIKEIIDEAFQLLKDEGVPQYYIDTYANAIKMNEVMNQENTDGVSLIESAVNSWAATGNPLQFVENRKIVLNLKKMVSPKSTAQYVKKNMLEPEQCIVTITRPVAGLLEKNAEADKQFFAQKKAAMSPEEIENLKKDNAEYDLWLERNESINLIDKVKVVKVQDLPEEIKHAEYSDEMIDGIRILTGINKGAEYVSSKAFFDLSAVPVEDIHKIIFYFELAGSLDTENYSLEELEHKISNTFYSFETKATPLHYRTEGYTFYGSSKFVCLNEEMLNSFKLQEEILLRTKLSDFDRIRNITTRYYMGLKQDFISSPMSLISNYGYYASDINHSFDYYCSDLPYLRFLEEVSQMDDSQMQAFTDELYELRKKYISRQDMLYDCIADKKQIKTAKKEILKFAAKLDNTNREPVSHESILHEFPKSMAIVVPGTINYNAIIASNKSLGMEELEGRYPVMAKLVADKILMPILRYKKGVYGPNATSNRSNQFIYAYRDPNIAETFEVFKSIPEELEKLSITQEDIDGFISSIYSQFAMSESDFSVVARDLSNILLKEPNKDYLIQIMKSIKATTTEDIPAAAALYKKIYDTGIKITAGNQEQILANKNLYDLIITDYME